MQAEPYYDLRRSDGIFRSMYFSRSTENGLFVQSITNDDVLANDIRREHYCLGRSLQVTYGHVLVQVRYNQFNQFSNSGQTGVASSNELLKSCREFSF